VPANEAETTAAPTAAAATTGTVAGTGICLNRRTVGALILAFVVGLLVAATVTIIAIAIVASEDWHLAVADALGTITATVVVIVAVLWLGWRREQRAVERHQEVLETMQRIADEALAVAVNRAKWTGFAAGLREQVEPESLASAQVVPMPRPRQTNGQPRT
jgi:hypothetical protein